MTDFGKPREAGRAHLALAPRPAPDEEDAQGLPSRKEFRRKKEEAVRNFVAVAVDRDNASVLLECIYTAQLVRRRHKGFRTGILVHPDNELLAHKSGVFDGVFVLRADRSLRKEIQELKPDVVYSPDRDWRKQLASAFTGASVKIGGLRLRLVGRLLGFYDQQEEADLERLEQRGLRLLPEPVSLAEPVFLEAAPPLPQEPFVWLSLFDAHGVSGDWPVGHGARLARLLEGAGIRTVVPLPDVPAAQKERLEKEVSYLRRSVPGISIVEGATPQRRAAGMARAGAVVSPAGAETLLATLVGRPVVLLHDMRSFGRGRGLKVVEASTQRSKRAETHGDRRGESVLLRSAEALERHIRPSVEECINDCPACSFHSCMEHISPERVFENLKKVLLPF